MEEKITIETKTWQATEYEHKPRSMDWIWGLGLIALVVSVIAFWFHNPLFGIFVLLSGAILIMFTLRNPKVIKFELSTDGLKMGGRYYPMKKLKAFIIRDGSPDNKLLIEFDKYFMPIYTVPLPKEISREVEEELKKLIPIKEIHEPQTIQFMEKIGF